MAYKSYELNEHRYDAEHFYLNNPFNTPATNKMKVYKQLVTNYETEKETNKEKVFGIIDGLLGKTNDALFNDCNNEYQYWINIAKKELAKLESSELLAA